MNGEGFEFRPSATDSGRGGSQIKRGETVTAFAIPFLRKGEVGDGVFGYFSFLRSKTAGGAPYKMRDAPVEFPPLPEGDVGGAQSNGERMSGGSEIGSKRRRARGAPEKDGRRALQEVGTLS